MVSLAFLAGLTFTYFISCKHDDEIISSGGGGGSNITRGTENIGFKDGKTTFDKVHSNVNWATPFMGTTGLLTGRFNTFGFNKFNFQEDKPDSIYFEAYVYLNSVNTGEPGRDGGCLLGTFGTSAAAGNVDSNLAVIRSKKVVFSTTDKGYIVTADFKFHGVTKELTAKMDFIGKNAAATEYGYHLAFSILAISDFGIQSSSIADHVDIKCSANFAHN